METSPESCRKPRKNRSPLYKIPRRACVFPLWKILSSCAVENIDAVNERKAVFPPAQKNVENVFLFACLKNVEKIRFFRQNEQRAAFPLSEKIEMWKTPAFSTAFPAQNHSCQRKTFVEKVPRRRRFPTFPQNQHPLLRLLLLFLYFLFLYISFYIYNRIYIHTLSRKAERNAFLSSV